MVALRRWLACRAPALTVPGMTNNFASSNAHWANFTEAEIDKMDEVQLDELRLFLLAINPPTVDRLADVEGPSDAELLSLELALGLVDDGVFDLDEALDMADDLVSLG